MTKPLSDEKIEELWHSSGAPHTGVIGFARAIEAAVLEAQAESKKSLRDRVIELFDYEAETGTFRRKYAHKGLPAGEIAGKFTSGEYLTIGIDGKHYLIHRLVWMMENGELPLEMIDHINGVKTDNRIGNLRLASRHQNQQNRKAQKNSSTGYKGVYINNRSGKPVAKLRHCGKNIHIGTFNTVEEAAIAYNKKARELWGEFAYMNVIAAAEGKSNAEIVRLDAAGGQSERMES